jgi:hypothetical protein
MAPEVVRELREQLHDLVGNQQSAGVKKRLGKMITHKIFWK